MWRAVNFILRISVNPMSGKGISRVLRCGHCKLKAIPPGFVSQRRTFAQSNACQKHGEIKLVINLKSADHLGAVPAFTEVSTPELQGLLSTFRENVFLPAHLSKAHRDLVYGARHKNVLESDLVRVEIAGEEFRLKHIDRIKDEPSTTKGLLEIIANMKDKKDWRNLPILLEGLNIAGRKVKPQYLEKLVRKAGQAGRQDAIFECARRAAKTGFVLKDLELVRKIFFWIQHKTMPDGQYVRGQTKALRMAEQTALLMEKEMHSGGVVRGNTDPRVRPEVIGVLLRLAVESCKLTHNGEDKDGKVEIYAQRLLGSLARGIDLRQNLPATEAWYARSALLCNISPMIYGMRGAIEILGPKSETAIRLKEHERSYGAMAATERELLSQELEEGALPLGAWTYDVLLGSATR